MTGLQVIILLQSMGMTIDNFNSIPDGEKGLPILHTAKIDADKTLPFLFSEEVSLVVCGGRGMKTNIIIFTVQYDYKHFRGTNGKSIVIRSDDGGESFDIS